MGFLDNVQKFVAEVSPSVTSVSNTAGEHVQENEERIYRIGIPLNVVNNMIADLNLNEELKAMFGNPVSAGLVIVAEKTDDGDVDLRIEDAGVVKLSPQQTKRFTEILDYVIKTNSG